MLTATGEYRPTTEPGKIALGAGQAALGGLAFGGGAPAALANAAAGGIGQGATDLTGDPLSGMDGKHHLVPLDWIDHVDAHVHLSKTLSDIKAATAGAETGPSEVDARP